MEKDHKWLESYIEKRKIKGKIIVAPDVQTVEKAAKRLNCSKKQIFKSIVFIDENGRGIIGVVDGESKVDKSKLEKIWGKKLRIAERHEVLKLTGFSTGGVSPFGTGCTVFIDKKVMKQETVIGGGGDEDHLIKLNPQELLKEGKVADIARD